MCWEPLLLWLWQRLDTLHLPPNWNASQLWHSSVNSLTQHSSLCWSMLIWRSSLLLYVSSGAQIAISTDHSTRTLETRWSALWFSMRIILSWSFWCTGAWEFCSVSWTVAGPLAIDIRPLPPRFRVTDRFIMAQAITSITSTQLFWTLSSSLWCLVLVFLTYSLLLWPLWSFSTSLRRPCFISATCSHQCMTSVSMIQCSDLWSTRLCSS